MAAVHLGRYEFALVEVDECGRKFLQVPEPISRRQFPGDERRLTREGDTFFNISAREYQELLDPAPDVRPEGFWWVLAELNGESIVSETWLDLLETRLPIAKRIRTPAVEDLLAEILVSPPFFERNRTT